MPIETPIRPAAEPFPNYDQQQHSRHVISDKAGSGAQSLRASPGHVKHWDPQTAASLANLEANMSARPPKQAWVAVLHPWPISVNGGRLMRDIAPPAGLELLKDGHLSVHRYVVQGMGETKEFGQEGIGLLQIPWYEPDLLPQENGSYVAAPILPIEQAGQYAREGNSNALWGPGVIIYHGELPPEQMWNDNVEVPIFDILGKGITRKETVRVGRRGHLEPVEDTIDVPVLEKFRDAFRQVDEQRIGNYLRLVSEADDQWTSSEGRERKWYVGRNLRLMANALLKMKRIKKLPLWAFEHDALVAAVGPQEPPEKCVMCRLSRPDADAPVCQCGWPFDALEAYRRNLVQFEHLAIHSLPIKELEQAYKLKAERDEVKKKMEAKFLKSKED